MLKLAKTSAPNNQVAVYTGGRQLEWREVESGQLPSPRNRIRAVMMDNQIFVTGGQEDRDDDWIDLTSILSWDPSTESWHEAIVTETVMAALNIVSQKEHISVATNGWILRSLPRPSVTEESVHLMLAVLARNWKPWCGEKPTWSCCRPIFVYRIRVFSNAFSIIS